MNGKGELGALIRQARRAKGLTQTALAQKAFTTQKSISRIENGRDNPAFLTMLALLHALDLNCVIQDGETTLFSLH